MATKFHGIKVRNASAPNKSVTKTRKPGQGKRISSGRSSGCCRRNRKR